MRAHFAALAAIATLSPAFGEPCETEPDLQAEIDTSIAELTEDPAAALARVERLEEQLVCLQSAPEPLDLARMWQVGGLALQALDRDEDSVLALRQSASMPVEEPALVIDDVDRLEAYFEGYSDDWALGRLLVGPVNIDAAIFVDGVRQNRTFAPVRAPAKHLVQIFEEDALVFARLVDTPEGDTEVSTDVEPESRRTRRKRSEREPRPPRESGGGKGLRLASVAVGGVALGLGAASYAYNRQAASRVAANDRFGAARAFDTHQTLAIAAAGTGGLAALGFGLSFAGRF